MVDQQNFSEIGITDDFMFATVFRQNKAACKRLLESILGFEISKLEYVNDQESISTYKSSHSIRLDIVARDNGAIYDIEMQKLNRGDIIKRSRYYQSQIDVAEFLKGKNYKKLKDSYIIFICMFDLFGLDEYIYQFENYDESLKLKYGDGAKKIIINAKGHKGNITEDLKAFINYLNTPEYADKEFANDFIKQLDDAVLENFKNDKWRTMRMKYEADVVDWLDEGEERGIKKGIAKGREEGRAEGKVEGIVLGRENERSAIRKIFELAREGRSAENIAAELNMSNEYVEETLDMLVTK